MAGKRREFLAVDAMLLNVAKKQRKKGLRKNPQPLAITGRDERIRTSDPVLPKHVLYQAEPHPDIISLLTIPAVDSCRRIVDHMYPEFLGASTKKKAGTPF